MAGVPTIGKLSQPQQSALAALAAAGLVLPPVANNFDPSVTGLAGPIGAIVGTVDGTTGVWSKYGAGNTSWKSLKETRGSATASGGPSAAMQITADSEGTALNIPTTARVELSFDGVGSSGYEYLWLTVGGTAATVDVGIYNGVAVTTPRIGVISVARTSIGISISKAIDGRRRVAARFASGGAYTYCGTASILIQAGAITSIGIQTLTGNLIADGSTLMMRSTQDLWGVCV